MEIPSVSRRQFIANGAVATSSSLLTAASYGRVIGANDRIGVGFIGYGLIGKRHVIDFKEQHDVNMVGVSEAHHGRLEEAVGFIGGSVKGHRDFRSLLSSRDIDTVVVSTPDHWHALMTMMACAAGKDVYVEKPLTLFAREGQWMIDTAQKHGRVVQIGTQQRSGSHYLRAKQLIRQGHIGKITSVRAMAARNIMPGYGSPVDSDPPAELDWNMWLGPAPMRQYNANRAIYHFRWFWDYSGGQVTNLGQHSLDIVDWVLGVGKLRSVSSSGGRYCLMDNGETPDTQDAIFEFDDWTATWSHRECSRGERPKYSLQFHGTKGSLGISRAGFEITADRDIPPENTVPQFTGAHPVGGPKAKNVGNRVKYRTQSIVDNSGDGRKQFKDHARNFLDCMRSRKMPVSNLESGHRVATMCHLANLSLRLGRRLQWDSKSQSVIDDSEANALLTRDYRSPWSDELRSISS